MAISFSGYTLVPELQHFYREFILKSIINKDRIPPPSDINPINFPPQSFINLLLNDEYPADFYEYNYTLVADFFCVPRQVTSRLQIYPGMWQYVNLDPAGDNIFELTSNDLIMLDALLAYRMDSTSLTIIDSTSISIITDATAGLSILFADYNTLDTCLSKLIYLYLQVQIYDNYQLYDNTDLISSCSMSPASLLCSIFESYVLDAYFKFMMNRASDMIYKCTPKP